MSRLRGWKRLFRLPLGRLPRIEPDVDDELNGHLERRIEELIERGADLDEARQIAFQGFGDLERTRRYCSRMTRRTRRRAGVRRAALELLQDFTFAGRLLRRSPGLTTVTVFALALGVGVNTTVFNFFSADARPPSGIREPERLRSLSEAVSYQTFRQYREHNRSFSGLAAWRETQVDVGSGDATQRFDAASVSSNYFEVLGVRMQLGRTFSLDEERELGAHPVVIISARLWRIRFGGKPGVLDSSITLNGRDFVVVGIAPDRFQGHVAGSAPDLWLPLSMFREANPGALAGLGSLWNWLRLVGRLAPGVTIEQAQTDVSALDPRVRLSTKSAASGNLGTDDRVIYAILFTSSGLLLVVVWANLASLFLARMTRRRSEIALRMSLGAGQGRIFRQLLSEVTLLALLGGAAGFVVATWCNHALLIWLGGEEYAEFGTTSLSPDKWVLGFTLLLSITSTPVLGVALTRQVSRLDFTTAMKGQPGATARSSPLRGVLVASQVALSLTLLACAGLLHDTVDTLRGLHPPLQVFEADRVLLVDIQPSRQGHPAVETRALFRSLQQRIATLPGVVSVTLARGTSVKDEGFWRPRVAPGDVEHLPDDSWITIHYNVIAPRYFETLGTELLAGRDLAATDRDGSPPVIIVNETLAHLLWPGEDPIGKRLRLEGRSEAAVREVVGLAKDRPPEDGPHAYAYFPLFQEHDWELSASTLHIRTVGEPMAMLPAVRQAVHSLEPNLPLVKPRILQAQLVFLKYIDEDVAEMMGTLIGIAGLLALALAAVALYGVISYGVSARTREIGIRMAVGARKTDVLRQVLRQGVGLALLGTGIGLVTTVLAARILSSWFFEISDMDPAVFVRMSIVLICVATLASLLPARRASAVDPVEALRAE